MRAMKRKVGSDKADEVSNKVMKESDPKLSDEPRKSRFDSSSIPAVKPAVSLLTSPFDLVDYPYDSETDKTTTNLFLGNLNPELTEQHLCEIFGRFGPLASVKVMWPRTEEEKARGRNCGFVAFMNRGDGEMALERLRGAEVCGYEMKLGWGKTVLIPPHPVYVPPALIERIKPPPFSGLPFNAQPREWLQKIEKSVEFERTVYDMFTMTDEELVELLRTCVVKVTIPIDRPLLQLINRMIEFVIREGVEFEAYIMSKEVRNPNFRFLFDFQSPEHVYYRWRLYSILNGDTIKNWKTDEFIMYSDGPYWRPPPLNPYTSGMPEDLIEDIDYSQLTIENLSKLSVTKGHIKDTDNDHPLPVDAGHIPVVMKNVLTDAQREELKDILENLEPIKFSIGEAMVWCLEHADFADEVLEIIVQQMEYIIGLATNKTMDGTNTPTGSSNNMVGLNEVVGLLFLVSDILHNSCAKVKNASSYRKHIETILPRIVIIYNSYYQSLSSKIKSEQLKAKVLSCFRAWGDWYVYPFDYLMRLQNQFLGYIEPQIKPNIVNDDKNMPSVSVTTSASTTTDDNLLDGKPLVDYDGDPLDIDGIPLERQSGGTTSGADSAAQSTGPKPKLSNKTMEILDMFANPSSPTHKHVDNSSLFVPSKWETVDPAEEEAELVQSRWQLMEQQGADSYDKKSVEDNEDPDGFPLSDNDTDGYRLLSSRAGVGKGGNNSPVRRIKNDDSMRNVSSLVSYDRGSSSSENGNDNSDEDNINDHHQSSSRATIYHSSSDLNNRHHHYQSVRDRNGNSDDDWRRSPTSKYRRNTSSSLNESGSYRSSDTGGEGVRSKVIRLEQKDDGSGRRSAREPRRDSLSGAGGSRRSRTKSPRRRSRSRRRSSSRSPSGRRSQNRKSSRR